MGIKLSEVIDVTKLSRRARRALSRGDFAISFEPKYNGKAPITKAEYEANNGKPAPKKVAKTRKYGEIKAVLPKKAKVAQ